MPVPSNQFELFLRNPVSRWVVKSADYTAISGDKIIADTSAATWTLTLPENPSVGDYMKIILKGSNYLNLVFGQNYDGAPMTGPVGFELPNQAIEFVFINSAIGWTTSQQAFVSSGN